MNFALENLPAPVDAEPFVPNTPVELETESSLWLIVPDSPTTGHYLRTPKDATPRPQTYSIGDRLHDETWHAYERLTWTSWAMPAGQIRLNIKPMVGPPDGIGIMTGIVLSVRPFVGASA